MDNATGDNKNRFVFCFWSLLVAKGIFREVYVNFILVGHTYNDIDALFGRWSMSLRKESFPTIPLLMKSFMELESIPTILHLIEEVLDFKGFIAGCIAEGDEALRANQKPSNLSSLLIPMVVPCWSIGLCALIVSGFQRKVVVLSCGEIITKGGQYGHVENL
jgi:hypothetical protein